MIPNCLLEKTNKEMMTLKRVPRALFRDPETIRRVESDNFLQVVIDCYAYAAWPHLGLGKKMEVYCRTRKRFTAPGRRNRIKR